MDDRVARETLLDEMLRGGIPEIKLALGDTIDRENARPLPAKYARLLPDTVLSVILRGDAGDAVLPIAADLERELTDSCNRHGSLYDRRYRVKLQRTDDPDAPLYTVTSHSGKLEDPEPASAASDRPPPPAPRAEPARAPQGHRGAIKAADSDATMVALPLADADATRIDLTTPARWDDGRWVLVVEGEAGEEREVFRITEPLVTVGRTTEDPALRASIAISDAPHVSRRQLALVWDERDGAPGFAVYNLGLNTIHLPGLDIQGARISKGDLDLGRLSADHRGWLPPGVPLRIGEHGPTVKIDEIPPSRDEALMDPDATVFE